MDHPQVQILYQKRCSFLRTVTIHELQAIAIGSGILIMSLECTRLCGVNFMGKLALGPNFFLFLQAALMGGSVSSQGK